MDKNLPIAFVALSMLAIAGCTIRDTPEAVDTTTTPTPIQSFNDPVVPSKEPEPIASKTPNLIQLTNAREREQIVSKGRDDPFAELFEPSVFRQPTDTTTRTDRTVPPLATPTETTPTTPRTPTPTAPTPSPEDRRADNSQRPEPLPRLVPDLKIEPVLTPQPQPELAEGVMVSGVVLIGQKPQAIIKVPNEATSRYVQAGQRLGSGLLIKRIEMNEGSDPIVILEQYGIEVARMVGEEPVESASSAANVEAS